MTKYIQVFIIVCTFFACGSKFMDPNSPENVTERLEEFISKEKFIQQPYPDYVIGVRDVKLRKIFTDEINYLASNFIKVVASQNPTDSAYQETIRVGLSRFAEYPGLMDTNEREMIGDYIEELMEIVGLESTDGQLEAFKYSFDSGALTKEEWMASGDIGYNVIVHQKGHVISIITTEFENSTEMSEVFVFNETSEDISITDKLNILPNRFKILSVMPNYQLQLGNGTSFTINEEHAIAIGGKKAQVRKLEGDALVAYGVPEYVEWAYVMVPEAVVDVDDSTTSSQK